jgi:hypothetical protein
MKNLTIQPEQDGQPCSQVARQLKVIQAENQERSQATPTSYQRLYLTRLVFPNSLQKTSSIFQMTFNKDSEREQLHEQGFRLQNVVGKTSNFRTDAVRNQIFA